MGYGKNLGGWNWFSLKKDAVEYVLKYIEIHPEYCDLFKKTYCCDELFFTTILANATDQLQIVKNNSLRYIDWHPNRKVDYELPLILDERDYTKIVNSGMLFCRKVSDDKSKQLMDWIDGTEESNTVN